MTTKWRRIVMVGVLLGLALLVVRARASAARLALSEVRNAPGELDTSFGDDGLVTTDFDGSNDVAYSIAVQSDGKIVVAGIAAIGDGENNGGIPLARYNADGSLDTSFGGGDGIVTTEFAEGDGGGRSVALQPDGKIVVAGTVDSPVSDFDFALARYNADGSLDTSFGDGDGLVITDFAEGTDIAEGVVLQPDGKFVLAGHTRSSANYATDFALARYNANGSLDTSFDGDGLVTTEGPGRPIMAYDVTLQPDDKIVVAGYMVVEVPDKSGSDGVNNDDFALARYNANGSLDTSFGDGDGLVTTDFAGERDWAQSVALQPDGKIVVAGSAVFPGHDFDSALARYNTNGSLDTSFDGDGLVNSGIAEVDDVAESVALQPNGKLVVAGYIVIESSGIFGDTDSDFALTRYNANGSPDTSFGGDGLVTTGFTDKSDHAYSVALQPDGRIIAAGRADISGTYHDFALARYEGDLYLYLPLIAR